LLVTQGKVNLLVKLNIAIAILKTCGKITLANSLLRK